MQLKDFNYHLPRNLIAQKPISPRDRSRLLVLHKKSGEIENKHFYDIIDYLRAGEVLVLNNTKVMPARLIGKRAGTGGKVEVFLLKKYDPHLSSRANARDPLKGELEMSKGFLANARNDNSGDIWQCLIGGQKRKENLKIEFTGGLKAEVAKNNLDGTWNVKFNKKGAGFMKIVQKIGQVPLPPYIKRDSTLKLQNDKNNYQTVYADDKKIGSVAAPTAGFHFTPALLKKIKSKGVQIEYITLQVGLGTFAPVKVSDITKHKMHLEYAEVNKKTLENIIKAKSEGRRIIAVGTTSARTLESVFSKIPLTLPARASQWQAGPFVKGGQNALRDYQDWTDIFIFPGYKFKIVDTIITNFHLPKSTLVMLVSAFAGRDKIFEAYEEAVKKKYRFFSYGDAMLIM